MMPRHSRLRQQHPIQTLENLVLMSGSGTDMTSGAIEPDVELPGFTDDRLADPRNLLVGMETETAPAGALPDILFASSISSPSEVSETVAEDSPTETFDRMIESMDEAFLENLLGELSNDDGVDQPERDTVALESTVAAFTAEQSSALSATPAPYAQYLILNGQDNDAVLEDNGNPNDDLLQLRSLNGSFETIVFQMPTDQLVIELGDGNDSLSVDGQELGNLAVDLFIYGQEGDDSIQISALETSGNIYSDDQSGDNEFRAGAIGGPVNIGGDVFIADGDGEQTVSLWGIVDGNVNVVSTSGGSLLTLGESGGRSVDIRGSLLIENRGAGDDEIRFGGRILGDIYIDSGDGDFLFRSIFSSVRGSFFTNVATGNSSIFLGDFSAGAFSSFNSLEGNTDTVLTAAFFLDGLTISNGLGFDQLRVDGSLIGDDSGVPGLLIINNGDGGSSTSFNQFRREFTLRVGVIRITNGAGEDTVNFLVRERDTIGKVFVKDTEGDTTLEVQGGGLVESIRFQSGAGADVITIDGVDVETDLIIDTGSGERTLDVQNSVVGNLEISGEAALETNFGDSNDEIFAPLGNNFIDGGGGDDVLVVYEGTSADFEIRFEDDGTVVVEGPGLNGTTVRNVLSNVERIRFNDREVILSEQGGGDPAVTTGTEGDDWIAVPERGGVVEAGAGDDAIYAPLGNDVNLIDGGAGIDTLVIYQGARSEYTIRRSSEDSEIEIEGPGLNGSTVINRLTNVEFIDFTDQRVAVVDL